MELAELDRSTLLKLLDRRTRELKTLSSLANQKEQEIERYIELCGDNARLSVLQDLLPELLSQREENVVASRRALRDVKERREMTLDTRQRLEGVFERIGSLDERMASQKSEIEKIDENIELQKQRNAAALRELSTVQNRNDELTTRLAEQARLLANRRKEDNLLKEREKALQQQRSNLQFSLATNRTATKDRKDSVDDEVLLRLEAEIAGMKKVFERVTVSLEAEAVAGEEDLDQVYQDQIGSVSQKVNELRKMLCAMKIKADEEEKIREREIHEKWKVLEELRTANNTVRIRIEDVQASLPEALGQITRELEMWQKKIDEVTKGAKAQERKINAERDAEERRLEVAEECLVQISVEVMRSDATISQQIATNEARRIRNDRMKSDLESLIATRDGLRSEGERAVAEITELRVRITEQKKNVVVDHESIRALETEFRGKIEALETEIRQKEVKIESLPGDDVDTSAMNEDQIRDSVEALGKQLAVKNADIEAIRGEYEQAISLGEKFEAALALIGELEDERGFMTDELNMLREQFAETVRTLENAKRGA